MRTARRPRCRSSRTGSSPARTRLPEITGVVLAGGRSSRFGGDKLLAEYRGAPILHHVVLRLAEVCGDVVVVVAPDASEPPMPLGVPVRFARDVDEGEGPLAGAYAGLHAVRTEHAMLAGGDMPDLRTGVLLEMVRVADEAPVDGVALADGDRFRPLPCIVRTTPAREIAHTFCIRGDAVSAICSRRRGSRSWTRRRGSRSTRTGGRCSTSTSRVTSLADRFGVDRGGNSGRMQRTQVERKVARREPRPEVVPLDPRDPDVVRAKAQTAKRVRRRDPTG